MFHWTYYLWLFAITYISTIIVIGILRKQRVHSRKAFLFPYKMFASTVGKLNIGFFVGLFVVVMAFLTDFTTIFFEYSKHFRRKYWGGQEMNQYGGFVHRNF